jgi:hypothetical protein
MKASSRQASETLYLVLVNCTRKATIRQSKAGQNAKQIRPVNPNQVSLYVANRRQHHSQRAESAMISIGEQLDSFAVRAAATPCSDCFFVGNLHQPLNAPVVDGLVSPGRASPVPRIKPALI